MCASSAPVPCWSSRAGLGPPAELAGARQGAQAAADPALLRPTHCPVSSLSKATSAPAACLCCFLQLYR